LEHRTDEEELHILLIAETEDLETRGCSSMFSGSRNIWVYTKENYEVDT
jgi:hypothetical protein